MSPLAPRPADGNGHRVGSFWQAAESCRGREPTCWWHERGLFTHGTWPSSELLPSSLAAGCCYLVVDLHVSGPASFVRRCVSSSVQTHPEVLDSVGAGRPPRNAWAQARTPGNTKINAQEGVCGGTGSTANSWQQRSHWLRGPVATLHSDACARAGSRGLSPWDDSGDSQHG